VREQQRTSSNKNTSRHATKNITRLYGAKKSPTNTGIEEWNGMNTSTGSIATDNQMARE